MTTYEIMWNRYKNGEISETEWRAYVSEVFENMMKESSDILVRLKECE